LELQIDFTDTYLKVFFSDELPIILIMAVGFGLKRKSTGLSKFGINCLENVALPWKKRGRRVGGGGGGGAEVGGAGRWCSCSSPVAIPGCQRLRRLRLEDNKSS